MPKKNQSKSDKKVFHVNNQKKPLPEPDPTLIQIARKFHKASEGSKGKESEGSKGKESIGSKGKESIGSKGKESIGSKGKESIGSKRHK